MNYIRKSSCQLIRAVIDEDSKLVAELLENGINVNARDSDEAGNGVLYYAVLHKSAAILELLLQHGAYVDDINYGGTRAIDTALMLDRAEHFEILLRHGARVPADMVIKTLKKSDRSRSYADLLYRHVELLNRDANGMGIMHLSATRGDVQGLEILLKRGASANERTLNEGLTPLHIAAKNGHVKYIELLLKHEAKVHLKDEFGMTPLHTACWRCTENDAFNLSDQLEIIKKLLTYGANVNATTNNGLTPLHFAANKSMIEYMELLVENGADPRLKDDSGDLPLHRIAISSKALKANDSRQLRGIQIFLRLGVDVNSQNNNGITALHLYVGSIRARCVEMLLLNGANPNLKDVHGYTPLHICAKVRIGKADRVDRIKVMQMLLSAGADIDEQAKNAKTPLYYAVEVKATALVRALLKHMAIFNHSYDKVSSIERLLHLNNAENLARRAYYSKCTKEIDEMRKQKVLSSVSFYDFLIEETRLLSKWVRNSEVVESLIDRRYEYLFPVYYRTLKRRFYEVIERNELMENAAIGVCKVVNFQIDTRNIITEKILNFLSVHDWQSLAEINVH